MSSNKRKDGEFVKMTEMTTKGGSSKKAKANPDERLRCLTLNSQPDNERIRKEGKYDGNTVVTSKYTVLSFLPKNLLEFFRVVANIYFLIISALQVGTNLSPTNPYTTVIPLTVVFIISMIKQGMEDLKRHQADARMNARKATVVRDGAVATLLWRNVRAGDIMLVRDREEVPADVVVLATSEEEGRCFTETSNLDGETNLKRRVALKTTADICGVRPQGGKLVPLERHLERVSSLRGSIEYENPNSSLYTFVGTVRLEDGSETPVGPSNVILRGCMVRSCAYVLGMVVFTGSDTKIMQNSRPTPFKQSAVYRMVNKCIVIIFVTQFLLCAVSTVMYWQWSKSAEDSNLEMWYLGSKYEHLALWDVLTSFVTFLILFNNLVPISLYVSLDMIKVVQAKLMEKDMAMCLVDEETGEKKFAKARTSDLNEDLGQIEYIFSDKTGTLTRNIMEFRKCSIDGVAYGFGTTEIGRAAMKRSRNSGESKASPGMLSPAQVKELSNPKKAQAIFNPKIHFDDPRLLQHLRAGGRRGALIHEFLTLLAVCHTVIPEKNKATGEVTYRAASPDEEALVKAAKCLGYDFQTPAPVVQVDMSKSGGPGSQQAKYEIVNVNEFNSTRKRMSVVVKVDGKYILYCKGADSVMYERALGQQNDRLLDHLRTFASEGLRTLVLARRQLSRAEYTAWNQAYQRAANSTRDRSKMLERVAEKVEVNLQIIGATAIEDKLQQGVPRCIADLAHAGIKIWVLTGDKEETAINIGYACKLLTNQMKLICVNQSDVGAIKAQLNVLSKFMTTKSSSTQLALVVDGKALRSILINRHEVKDKVFSDAETEGRLRMTSQFLSIARHCKAVVACRVSPAQKAAIVKVVRKGIKPQPLTLAIGDGANDVNMIQTAHVGVGISGQEGVQAVNSSDYAIAQFRFLKPLLLVHGRLNYKRIAKVILYSFYKNIALVICLFLFNFYNGFSGTTLFESFVMAGWNFFLALPIIVIGIADFDVIPYLSMRNPALYVSGPWKLDLNVWRFLIWIINAIGHAMVAFFLPRSTFLQTWASDGQVDGLYVHGTTIYSCLLMTMNYKVGLETRFWTFWNHFFFWGSIASYFLFLVVYNVMAFGTPPFYYSAFVMFTRPTFWLLLALVPFACIIFDLTTMHLIRSICPVPGQVLAERYKLGMPVDEVKVTQGPVTSETVNPMNDVPSPSPHDDLAVDDRAGMLDMAQVEHTGYDFNTAVDESHFAHESSETNFFNRMRKQSATGARSSSNLEMDRKQRSSSSVGRSSGAGAGAGAGGGGRRSKTSKSRSAHAMSGSQRSGNAQ